MMPVHVQTRRSFRESYACGHWDRLELCRWGLGTVRLQLRFPASLVRAHVLAGTRREAKREAKAHAPKHVGDTRTYAHDVAHLLDLPQPNSVCVGKIQVTPQQFRRRWRRCLSNVTHGQVSPLRLFGFSLPNYVTWPRLADRKRPVFNPSLIVARKQSGVPRQQA